MIVTLISLQIASCGQNFTFSKLTNSCVCELLLSSNKSMCAEKCEDFNEKLVNGKCVKSITHKGATYTSTTDCITAYNQGSQWDGGSGCKCSQGYAGTANSFCTDCRRLGQQVSGNLCAACSGNTVLQNFVCSECTNMIPSADKLSCVTCSSRYGDGSIYSSSGTCVCDTANGFAGATNSVCTDCWRKGQAVSGTSCAACSGTQVLQSGSCAECPANFVPSVDKQSCVSCSQRYGQGSIYSAVGTCICDSSNGFSGASNSICSYCWVLGKTISGTSCASCSGTQVLQSGTCQECPTNLVPSADKLSCVSCASRYGEASTFVSFGLCRCTAFGFAGSDNSVCSDCLRMGQMISGATCSSCSGTQVLQSGVCQECPANFVPSADKVSCVACSSKFGEGSVFFSTGICRCSDVLGFGGNDNEICSDCWRQGKSVSGAAGATACAACSGTQVLQAGACADCPANLVQSADKLSCVSCASRYGEASTFVSYGLCRCTAFGFAGSDNSVCSDCLRMGQMISGATCSSCSGTQVLQSGVCQECPANFVPSADKVSCVACSSKFGEGSVFFSTGICRCSDVLGFAGGDNGVCSDCWRQGQSVTGTAGSTTCAACSGTTVLQAGACAECPTDFVPSSDKLSCISCSQRYGDGSSYSAVGTCVCDSSNGFTAASSNSACTDCWRQGKAVSGNTCASCTSPLVLQQGACAQCSNDLVPSADGLSCVTWFRARINSPAQLACLSTVRVALTPPSTPAPARSLLASAALTTHFAKTASDPGKRPRTRAAPPVSGLKYYNLEPAKIVRLDPSRVRTNYHAQFNRPAQPYTAPDLQKSLLERAGAQPLGLQVPITLFVLTASESARWFREQSALQPARPVLELKYYKPEYAQNAPLISLRVLTSSPVSAVSSATAMEALTQRDLAFASPPLDSRDPLIRLVLIAGFSASQFQELLVLLVLELKFCKPESAPNAPQISSPLLTNYPVFHAPQSTATALPSSHQVHAGAQTQPGSPVRTTISAWTASESGSLFLELLDQPSVLLALEPKYCNPEPAPNAQPISSLARINYRA
ncbi:Conserved_hypothetical protein [Hexamita inflata]|uniref:Uncharacterized protein n=1 Tax=Hexamita inflata TaxID=28002 RepID=A0AA86PXU9_9EUKA|nr:Conserved hypothetical protein [Hexamita inflata]